MGWYHTTGASRADIIAEVTREETWTHEGRALRRTVLRHCTRGNVLWMLVERDMGDGSGATKYVACYLLQRNREGWGYKPMDETVGPYYFTCPLSYLDAADPPKNRTAADWRKVVRARAATAKAARAALKSLKMGDTVVLVPGAIPARLTVTSLKPLRGRDERGAVYRVTPKYVDAVATVTANAAEGSRT